VLYFIILVQVLCLSILPQLSSFGDLGHRETSQSEHRKMDNIYDNIERPPTLPLRNRVKKPQDINFNEGERKLLASLLNDNKNWTATPTGTLNYEMKSLGTQSSINAGASTSGYKDTNTSFSDDEDDDNDASRKPLHFFTFSLSLVLI
jgi:hypothetical protein